MRKKGIIFDLDGVICFTDRFHYLAWKALADREGIFFDEAINNRLRGISRMESLDIILEKAERHYSDEEKHKLSEDKNQLYRQHLKGMTEKDLSEETLNTLKELRNRGYLLAIGSSSKNTPLILEKVGLSSFFDAVSDGNNITKTKPDPEVFLKAAEFLHLEPSECTVIEDAESGVLAAHAAGMKAVAVGAAANNNAGDWNIHNISDLLTIFQ